MSRKMNMGRGVVAAALALLLVGCASSGGGGGHHPASLDAAGTPAPFARPAVGRDAGQSAAGSNRLELRAFLLANRARREAGLPALEMRQDLVRLARIHAQDMAVRDFFSHYDPEGIGPGDRARANGVIYTVFAENLARVRYSDDPAALAVQGWLSSPGHRRNLLDETEADYRTTGVGVVRRADGMIYLSQVFLRR